MKTNKSIPSMKKSISGNGGSADRVWAGVSLASKKLDYARVEKLMKLHPKIGRPDSKRDWLQQTAWLEMHTAHQSGNPRRVKQLLKKHAWLQKASPRDDRTWLPLAVRGNALALARYWISEGFDAELDESLILARSGGMTKLLLKHGANPRFYDESLGTALHTAREPEQVRLLLAAGADPSITTEDWVTPFAKLKSLGRSACAELLAEFKGSRKMWSNPAEHQSRRNLKSNVTVDLRDDGAKMLKYLRKRVKRHLRTGLQKQAVKLITFGFEIGQGGWVYLDIDARIDARCDGNWVGEVEGNSISFPKWPVWHKLTRDATITLIDVAGKQRALRLGGYDKIIKVVGDALKAVLLKAREEGVFKPLNKGAGCELLVEHFDGEYCWPTNSMRGRNNLA